MIRGTEEQVTDTAYSRPEERSVTARRRTGAADKPWIERRAQHGWRLRLNARELWSYREVALFLALRDVKLRYRQTLLGVTWVLIQPLAVTALFSIVFGHLAHVPSDGLPYAPFAYVGMAAWAAVSTACQAGAMSLVESRELVTKLYFPRLLAPLGAVAPALLDIAVALAGLVVIIPVYGLKLSLAFVLLPLWIVAAVGVALAITVWLSALNVRFRDVRYALPFLIQFWLIASPVAYPSSLITGVGRWLYSINPIVGVIDGLRWSALGGPPPPAADLVSLLSALVLLYAGALFFRRTESRFADFI